VVINGVQLVQLNIANDRYHSWKCRCLISFMFSSDANLRSTTGYKGERQHRCCVQVAKHVDIRGDVLQLLVHCNTTINAYFTRAHFLRSGDVHECDQHNVILKGRIRRTMKARPFPVLYHLARFFWYVALDLLGISPRRCDNSVSTVALLKGDPADS
jgi:hypothetical protein